MSIATCNQIATVHAQYAREQRRHAAGCEAASEQLALCVSRGAGVSSLGSAIALAGILVQAYRDATLGPEAPEPLGHAAAVHAAGEELHALVGVAQLSGGLTANRCGPVARMVIGTYHATRLAEERDR
jgi:hypothetical protein